MGLGGQQGTDASGLQCIQPSQLFPLHRTSTVWLVQSVKPRGHVVPSWFELPLP
jgi:hypothetical protein